MNTAKTSKHAIRLINKCMWKGGADDLYKSSFRERARVQSTLASIPKTSSSSWSENSSQSLSDGAYAASSRRKASSNPMLNGVSMLQWFFDEVRPDQREVRYWMKYFSQTTNPSKPFAVIQISEDVFKQEEKEQIAKVKGELNRTILETLSLSIYFLQQNKMNLILLVGSSAAESAAPDNKRVRERIYANIMTLVGKLEENGTRSTPIFDGGHLFNTDKNFSIESLNTDTLDWMIGRANIPVIGCIGESCDGRLGVVQVDEGLLSLSTYTQPLKVLLLNAAGGITDHSGQRVTVVFLPKETELQRFVDQPWWCDEVENRFSKVYDILKVLPKQSSYVITSARDLLTELLTQRGVGTLFKKVVPVTKYKHLEDLVSVGDSDKVMLQDVLPGLVNSAFDRSTSPSYWRELPADLQAVYLTDDLKACAIVRSVPMLPGVAYLDKFAVCKEERGNFNIEILWQQLKHDYKSLFWRSRHDNIFNSWYETRSDGIVKVGYYHIFWFGLSSADINAIVKQCEDLPDSFEGKRQSG